jgi:hypothetical protein
MPTPHGVNLLGRDELSILMAQQVLQQHLEKRQMVHTKPVEAMQLPPAPGQHHGITSSQAVHFVTALSARGLGCATHR